MSGPRVTVDYRDEVLTALVADAARRVPGVVQLQSRPVASVVDRVRGRGVDGDTSAVDLGRDAHGVLEVAVRLVSGLHPAPLDVIADVADAVRGRLAEVGEHHVRVEVTVTDVRIPVR